VAKSEKEMKEIVKKKKLEMNVEKTKMMVFNKRKRKSEKNEWNWERRKRVGYTFSVRAPDKAHIKEIVRKANKTVGCVWEIGVLGVDRETPGSM
jgi:hypothetical protein